MIDIVVTCRIDHTANDEREPFRMKCIPVIENIDIYNFKSPKHFADWIGGQKLGLDLAKQCCHKQRCDKTMRRIRTIYRATTDIAGVYSVIQT